METDGVVCSGQAKPVILFGK